MVGWGKQAIL